MHVMYVKIIYKKMLYVLRVTTSMKIMKIVLSEQNFLSKQILQSFKVLVKFCG